ncbi:amino acid adenylation domain-containing protein [Metabacillus idriensis]|uniref:Amino acid adenylation domain-containing protein n=1 Tax=Metabacillus idriensis TaxID=324768 RepID=A0A6I2MFQ3_9BACI|nr:non-ribosomal peptide synthetase [Metabacillus idriensis]MCM3598077.1 amino acid adenylation domain-containing protein [Metabacillus idriensis]MRX56174.1 amino acid adenylation domain-containing protein [Metabacillus idriensis]
MELDFQAFEILSQDDQELIDEINRTEIKYEQFTTLPELFSKQAATTPERIAVKELSNTLSYSELDNKSNLIARVLHSAGINGNELVGIMLDRSIDFLPYVFGILKAGGAYVPIDPGYPKKRIRYMLHDSACRVLVTDTPKLKTMLNDLPESIRVIVCIDELDSIDSIPENLTIFQRSDLDCQSSEPWKSPTKENDIAYVVYTSGSTGDPKGVVITHKAILNTLFWLQDTFPLNEHDVIAQKTSISFTDSVWEFFWPMIQGAKLSIFSPDTVRDPNKLLRQLCDDEITITQFVPAQMSIFLEAVRTERKNDPLPRLKWVFNGGEALLVNTVRDWYSIFTNAKIANIYGMTESAIYATNYIIDEKPAEQELSIPLGKPIANTQIYILNESGKICPPGVKGEICIGGIGLTTGYWNKKELTDKAFITQPTTGKRLYCTGDLGLLRTDGIIEYLGRKDDQVQVRGYRVELKEVERAVSSYHLIKETAVIAQKDAYEVTNLLCYFISSEKGLEIDELIDHLKEILPNYMIPGLFMELIEMPLTPNGKIDRKNLPKPSVRTKRSTNYVAPRNEKEQGLARIWGEILNIPENEIGIHDSFFESGGNSISIIRLQRKMKAMGCEVTVAELFSYPTIATYMNQFENQNRNQDKLDGDLMSLLDQIEDGSIDIAQSMKALNDLRGGN